MRDQCSWKIGLLAVVMILLAASAGPASLAWAQAGPPKSGPMYDAATEVTMKGSVESVNQVTGPRGWGGTHLTLKTEKETIDVHAGPSSFLTQNKISFAKGDEIEITGSRVKFGDTYALLARTIKKGDQQLILRNERGIPFWSRSRRR